MKLVWSPETATAAYLDTVKSNRKPFKESGTPELVAAMAGGYKSRLIVEAWSCIDTMGISKALAVAKTLTGGRHVVIVPDESTKQEYVSLMRDLGFPTQAEVVVGEARKVMEEVVVGVDFLLVDCRRKDYSKILRYAKFGSKGGIVICKNMMMRNRVMGSNSIRQWQSVLDGRRRVVYSKFLPVGKGLDIAHVASSDGRSFNSGGKDFNRWIMLVDQKSGEEHVFPRQHFASSYRARESSSQFDR